MHVRLSEVVVVHRVYGMCRDQLASLTLPLIFRTDNLT